MHFSAAVLPRDSGLCRFSAPRSLSSTVDLLDSRHLARAHLQPWRRRKAAISRSRISPSITSTWTWKRKRRKTDTEQRTSIAYMNSSTAGRSLGMCVRCCNAGVQFQPPRCSAQEFHWTESFAGFSLMCAVIFAFLYWSGAAAKLFCRNCNAPLFDLAGSV